MEPSALLTISTFVLVLAVFAYFIRGVLHWPPYDIFAATREFRYDYIRKSKEKGVDINKKDRAGMTPLMIACTIKVRLRENGTVDREHGDPHEEVLRLMTFLIHEVGANIEECDHAGNTALFFAVPDANKVKLLLEAGADVNAVNNDGETAVIKAAMSDAKDVVALCLQYGADKSISKAQDIEGRRFKSVLNQYIKMMNNIGDVVRQDTAKTYLGLTDEEYEFILKQYTIIEAFACDLVENVRTGKAKRNSHIEENLHKRYPYLREESVRKIVGIAWFSTR